MKRFDEARFGNLKHLFPKKKPQAFASENLSRLPGLLSREKKKREKIEKQWQHLVLLYTN